MKKINFFIVLLIVSTIHATNVVSLLDLYNVRDNLNGDYTQTAAIDLSPTNPINVSDWVSSTPYSVGDYVKYTPAGTQYTYICTTANSDATWTAENWKQLWESSKGWLPIGYDPTNNKSSQFLGTYDGSGYSISNLYINRPDEGNVGLFGHLGYDAGGVLIKKVALSTITVAGARGTGSLIGRVTGNENTLILQCSANGGTVVGDAAVGGLIGSHNSVDTNPSNRNQHPILQESWANINVSWSQKDAEALKFGGLVGCTQRGRIYYCYALGSVTVDNDPQVGIDPNKRVPERIGGLAGCILLRGYIENSFSAGQVTTTGPVDLVGGMVGGGGTGGSSGNAYSSFYDQLTDNPSTTPAPISGETSISGVTGETTANMKLASTFINAGWDASIWSMIDGNYPSIVANPHSTIYTITLTDGSAFAPSISPGNPDQAIGRFALSSSSDTGSALTRVTIRLVGTRTGASNFKLWKSSDNSFDSGSDAQKGSIVAADPGDGEYVSFAFDDALTTTTAYYFLTCNVASDATGSIQAFLEDNSSLSFFDGKISSTIDNARLSNSDNPLPVELTDFSASYSKNQVVLNWTTQSETDNLGWNLYRSQSENGYPQGNYLSLNTTLIPGMGTTTLPSVYHYADEYPVIEGNTYWYWLQSVSTMNELDLFGPVSLQIPCVNQLPVMTILEANYPNPFNPETTIEFNIKQNEEGMLTIYNLKGEKILSETFTSGTHKFVWNAEGLVSGIYFYKLSSPTTNMTRKMLLLR